MHQTHANRTAVTALTVRVHRLIAALLLFVVCGPSLAANPAPPGALRVEVYSATAAELFWNRATDDGIVVAYEVQLNNNVIASSDALSYFSDTLVAGRSYDVSVTSIDGEGDRSTPARTSFISGNRSSLTETSQVETPRGLTGSVYSSTSAEIMWVRTSTFGVRYDVSRNGALMTNTDAISFYDDELQPDTAYEYSVVAIDREGRRSSASSVSLNTPERESVSDGTPPDIAPPEPPTGGAVAMPTSLTGNVYSTRTAEITWDRSTTFGLRYDVSRDGALLSNTDGVSYYDDTLSPGTTYTYEVVAIDQQGQRSTPASIMLDTPGAGSATSPETGGGSVPGPSIPPTAGDALITEPSDVYQRDGYGTVDVIRIDIRTATTPGTCSADDESGCTLADVIADVDKRDDHTVDIAIHFKSDDFPDDGSVSNAEMRLRGGGSRFAQQKSFRIKLDSKEVLWRDERYLQLNKHPFESSRIRNKLAMDTMIEVPNLPSLRTQFVNLWIDDGDGAVDYGLYTHVERVNENYLEKRGWDDSGNLYKAEDFRFDESDLEDIRVDSEGEPLDEDRFESSLEIENGDDHRNVVAMMTALHDPNRTFDSVLDQYFDRANVTAWMATNILLHQADAVRHNFILYNPIGTEKLYFLPWDYDAAMGLWVEPPNDLDNDSLRQRVEYGYAVAAGNPFLERFYRQPSIHAVILRAAQSLRQNYVTDASMAEKANGYINLVAPYEQRAPDSQYNTQFTVFSAEKLSTAPAENEEALRSRFGMLMPPTLDDPELREGRWRFTWQAAYDVTGTSGDITYQLQIATTPTFEPDNLFVNIEGIDESAGNENQTIDANRLPTGEYYVRLIARPANEPERFWQVSGNRLHIGSSTFYGPLRFRSP